MRFAFIHAHASQWPIRTMCRVLEVSRAGYYAWCARPASRRHAANATLGVHVRSVYAAMRERYGSPRVHRELTARGIACGRHRVARLMRREGLRARSTRRFRVTTDSAHPYPAAANTLARAFEVAPLGTSQAAAPRPVVWMADMTYVPTQEGWLFLAVVLDRATRRVVGWALDDRLHQRLPLAALDLALRREQPTGGVHHSDRGSQYASHAYRGVLVAHGFTASMSRPGDCWDNAVVESFLATLTKELLGDAAFATRAEARAELVEFIEIWYNRQRRHSALAYHTPAEYAELLQRAG